MLRFILGKPAPTASAPKCYCGGKVLISLNTKLTATKQLELTWQNALTAAAASPQIFINNQHIGGCDDLYQLDTKAQLDPLLFQVIGN